MSCLNFITVCCISLAIPQESDKIRSTSLSRKKTSFIFQCIIQNRLTDSPFLIKFLNFVLGNKISFLNVCESFPILHCVNQYHFLQCSIVLFVLNFSTPKLKNKGIECAFYIQPQFSLK